MDAIIARLRRNAEKQRRYRHIVRGRALGTSRATAKRIADINFLHHYAGMSLAQLARLYGVSRERVRQIAAKREATFTICHPKKSCM
jgi:DNA-directed RNA polymerase sigma subunit (sigma70/sigma32)